MSYSIIRNSPAVHQDQWIKEMWSLHTMEYDSVIKRNVVLMNATTYMNLENILNERSQSQNRPHIVWVYLYEIPKISRTVGQEIDEQLLRIGWGWCLEGSGC